MPLAALFALITAAFAAAPRFAVRAVGRRRLQYRLQDARRALIVGAGAAGEMIVKELMGHPTLGLGPLPRLEQHPAVHHHAGHVGRRRGVDDGLRGRPCAGRPR